MIASSRLKDRHRIHAFHGFTHSWDHTLVLIFPIFLLSSWDRSHQNWIIGLDFELIVCLGPNRGLAAHAPQASITIPRIRAAIRSGGKYQISHFLFGAINWSGLLTTCRMEIAAPLAYTSICAIPLPSKLALSRVFAYSPHPDRHRITTKCLWRFRLFQLLNLFSWSSTAETAVSIVMFLACLLGISDRIMAICKHFYFPACLILRFVTSTFNDQCRGRRYHRHKRTCFSCLFQSRPEFSRMVYGPATCGSDPRGRAEFWCHFGSHKFGRSSWVILCKALSGRTSQHLDSASVRKFQDSWHL